MSHRASYWKTTLSAFGGAAAGSVAIWALILWHLPALIRDVMLVPPALMLAASLLVAAGGLVCLWRDARHASGMEDIYARAAARMPAPGLWSKLAPAFLRRALRPGDLVRVRPAHEIEATLDARGELHGLPFMPEMRRFCGRVLRVHRRIDKINDMRNKTGLRRVERAVTLTGARCDGSAHGGCQAECQIIWRERWLERVPAQQPIEATPVHSEETAHAADPADRVYVCQMTRLWEASRAMSVRDIRQDLRPLLDGNVGFGTWIIAMLTRLFTRVQILRGGVGYPYMPRFAAGGSTPSADLKLAAGDKVCVRSCEEIAETLANARNRGLWFDRDMLRFCGRPAVVHRRVERVIHESTGRMIVMKIPCIALEGVLGTGEFLRLCSQHEYMFWREVWLRRDDADQAGRAQ